MPPNLERSAAGRPDSTDVSDACPERPIDRNVIERSIMQAQLLKIENAS